MVNDDVVGRHANTFQTEFARDEAIMSLTSRWHEFQHLGDVPTMEERSALQNALTPPAANEDIALVTNYSAARYLH